MPTLPRRIAFAIAGLIMVTLMMAAAAPSPLYPVYQQRWGFSPFMLTLIFAAYVVALLAALLCFGSLSDHLGRRPVLVTGLLLLTIAMLVFITASGVGGLLAARLLQGVATGAITGAASALIVDLQAHHRIGSLVTSGAPALGLGIGAVVAGVLVQHAPEPTHLIFWVLGALNLLLVVAIWFVPEQRSRPNPREVVRALRPSLGVPAPMRPLFVSLLPAMFASWALGGFYLSLGSSVAATVLGVHDHLAVGLLLGTFFLPAAIALPLTRDLPVSVRRTLGLGCLAAGVITTIVGDLLASVPTYIVGSIVAGVGFGVTFQVVTSAMAAATLVQDRAKTFATTYAASYVAFSAPALVAGLAVQVWGLLPTVVGYGVGEVLLVAAAALLARRTTLSVAPAQDAAGSRAAARSASCGPILDT